MSLTKIGQQPQPSGINLAGVTTNGSGFPVNYGISGLAQILNSGTGPTIGCTFNLQGSNDSGNTFFTISSQIAGNASNGLYLFPFSIGIAGNNGDWGYYRTQFTGNTAQSVTIQADASSTTSL
jgi:hypothetical protein